MVKERRQDQHEYTFQDSIDKRTNHERMPGSGLEDLPDTLSSLGTTLYVTLGTNLLCDGHTISPRDGSLVHPRQILNHLAVVSEILFARNENDGESLTEVEDL